VKKRHSTSLCIKAGVLACALAAGTVAPAPSAWAAPPPGGGAAAPTAAEKAAAKKHYEAGRDKFQKKDFVGAETEFKAANDVKSTPQAERFIGLCEDGQGHFKEAVDWYDKFLAHVPDSMGTEGDEIKKRDAEIKALPGKVHIESNPPGAAVAIDGKALPSPTPTDADLPPGSHTIKLTAEGRLPSEKPVDVAFASTQTVTADLEAAPPAPPPAATVAPPPPPPVAPPPPPPPPEPRSMIPAYVTGGLAIVAAGIGTVFGIIALGDKSDFDNHPTSQKADDGDTHALIADMSFGVALTFGVTSAVLFLTKDEPAATASSAQPNKKKTKAMNVTPIPIVGPHTTGAGFALHF
jgi:hypothetical protein